MSPSCIRDERNWPTPCVASLRQAFALTGQPLHAIPFVFHGPSHSRPEVAKSPIEDLVAANLDHYRLNADYKHGMHFTELPTAFVTGFEKGAELRIGSTTAWVTETLGATAGFLEFKGEGLATFERALDRIERLMTVLGSRLLETQKRVSESAEARPEDVKPEQIRYELNTDFEASLLGAKEIQALVSAWQSGAIMAWMLAWPVHPCPFFATALNHE
jgi:hypothetical protein